MSVVALKVWTVKLAKSITVEFGDGTTQVITLGKGSKRPNSFRYDYASPQAGVASATPDAASLVAQVAALQAQIATLAAAGGNSKRRKAEKTEAAE